jgi:hypothetical protein
MDDPPFLIFQRAGAGRDVTFLGLAAPRPRAATSRDDLVAVWRTLGISRFQNYRALFTILDEAVVSRQWLNAVARGQNENHAAPNVARIGRDRSLSANGGRANSDMEVAGAATPDGRIG